MTARQFPTLTINELAEGSESLEPTVQVMEVEVEAVTTHEMPSMTTVGVSKLR
jgi:hypothetical protein